MSRKNAAVISFAIAKRLLIGVDPFLKDKA
jgi:hypothetical protein